MSFWEIFYWLYLASVIGNIAIATHLTMQDGFLTFSELMCMLLAIFIPVINSWFALDWIVKTFGHKTIWSRSR